MTRRKSGAGGNRTLTVRVKKSKGRRTSSYRWLSRQLNDPYVARARAEGYRSRAAYKLQELDERYGLLQPGNLVVDLGCTPGGWSQIAAARINSAGTRRGLPVGRVIAVDLNEMEPLEGVEFLQMDIRSEDAPGAIVDHAGGPVDLVISDMAAPATGHASTDHLRVVALCEIAASFAEEVLKEGGCFVAKVLAGGTESGLLADLKSKFERVHHAKPKASRSGSSEKYVVALRYRGGKSCNEKPASPNPGPEDKRGD